MAIEHKDIPSEQRHEPKGIEAASASQVYVSTGSGGGSWQDYVKTFTNVVEVTSLSDFPTPVSGIITLEASTGYYISGAVNIAPNVIEASNIGVALLGFNRATDVLITSTPAALLNATNQNVILSSFAMLNLDPAGTLLNLANSATHSCSFDKISFGNCDRIGTIGDFQNIVFDNCGLSGTEVMGGITFTGTNSLEISIRDSFFQGWAGTLFDLGNSITTFVEVLGSRFIGTATDKALDGVINAGNIGAGGIGIVSNCLLVGMDEPLGSNIDHADIGWFFSNALGVQSSGFLGEMAMADNSTVTTIVATDTWTKVAGTTVASDSNERFAMSTTNELQASSVTTRPVSIIVNTSAIKTGGGTDTLRFTVFKDSGAGFQILNPNAISSIDASAEISSTGLVLSDTASPDDKYSLYVENVTSTSNAEIKDLQFVIRG